jgi:UDP-N-acetylglucosamine:LPS N-acetylglucosamine transferase
MLYANATLMLCRSGGMTAELAVVGMPSVLVPLPGAPGDHQTRNAEVFARAGAAVMVPDRELDGPRLARELDSLLADPPRLRAMEQAARSLGRTDATARFADLVEEVARGAR